jgi:hypothetical protein
MHNRARKRVRCILHALAMNELFAYPPRTEGLEKMPSGPKMRVAAEGAWCPRVHVPVFRKRWQVHIYYDSKQHYLGPFGTRQEAALAYDRAARQCWKDKTVNYESIEAPEEASVQAQAEVHR